MIRFFSKISASSVKEAKNRLKSVINSDRINVSQSKTLEKMRKEVMAVLVKYTPENAQPPHLTVSCQSGTEYVLEATVAIDNVSIAAY